MRPQMLLMLALTVCSSLWAQENQDPRTGLHSVALTTLGATAKGSGAPWNKDWPAINALLPGHGRPLGALFGAPMLGARTDIRLVIPVEIKGLEIFCLDYGGTRQVSEVEIYLESEKVKTAALPRNPGKGFFVPLDGKAQNVGVVVTGEHPLEELAGGKKGPAWGGFNRIRVYSTTDVAAMMADVEQYQIKVSPDFIAPTSGSIATGETAVYGKPRVAKDHPKTIWDQEDIEHYKEMLKSSKELQVQYEGLKKAMETRMQQPLGIPEPRKDEKGEYVHISDREVGGIHNNLGLDIANLGTLYVLSGDEKYAAFAKKLLLAYADAYPHYGVGARAGFSHDPSRVFDQRLGDATWLIQVARGYDLIRNSPMTPEERKHIEEDLVKASAKFIAQNSAHLRGATNWSAIGTCSILIAGVATDDQDLIDLALWGMNKGKSQGKWWEGQAQKAPSGVELHFSESAIDADGMWAEGAMGYQFMALQAVIADAEILWHQGIDLYRYRGGVVKRLFDSPLQYCYPDLKTPALHDSGHGSIVEREAYLYEFAYRRYKDPKHLLILKQAGKHLGASFQQFPVSVLYDVDLAAEAQPVEWDSVNFFGVGYGILRNTTPRGTVSLLMDYGPNRSHGHPDKLNIDLWGFGGRLLPDPGSVWYEQPLYRNWYHTTMAHNTLCVDELEQREAGADQLVYGPASTFGIQRARTNEAYSGVMMDRAVFVTPEYMADLFGAFARLRRKMDLAWHPIGTLESTDLKLAEFRFSEPMEKGYSELANTRAATTTSGYTVVVANPNTPLRLVAAGGPETQVIVGDGHLGLSRPPTVLQRRVADRTLWGNAADYSGKAGGDVKAVRQSGSVEEGCALLEVETTAGTDLCFVSYRPGSYEKPGLKTDALQAFVKHSGGKVSGLYLGGGTRLIAADVTLALAQAGLAYLEQAETGAWIVGNPSAREEVLTVTMPALAGMKLHSLDRDGKRTGELEIRGDAAGGLALALKPSTRVEFAPAGQASLYDHRTAMLRKRMAEQEAALRAAEDAARKRTAAREADAKRFEVPKNTVVVVQAESFTAEGGGTVKKSATKRAAIGECIFGWDSIGHWLEWTFDVPAEGYYHLAVLYCSEVDQAQRELRVNGEIVDEYITPTFASTGGWSNSSDDWRLFVVGNPVAGHPLLVKLKKGPNVIRLTNSNGLGINVDYLAIFSPDVPVTRELLSKRPQP